MSPGRYIAKRREAAGLDQVDVAIKISGGDVGAAEAAGVRLMRLEGDELDRVEGIALDVFLDQLRTAFAFDKSIFRALVAAAEDPARPVPPICRECACTFFDPCVVDRRRTCAWANAGSGEEPLCTFCEAKDPEPGLPPVGGAGREEVSHAA